MARILIVEDNTQLRQMLRMTLERAGYETAEAADGDEAIEMTRKSRYDVVITDIVMPEKDGLEMIRVLREDNPDTKIIAISGSGRVAPTIYLGAAKGLGAQRTFNKPLEREELLAAVRELLEQ